MWYLVLWPGIEHGPPASGAQCLRHWTTREVPIVLFLKRNFVTPRTEAASFPCPSPAPEAYSNSCPLSWWCHLTISSAIIPYSSHLQSFPASRSFLVSQFFTSGGQSIAISASTSVLPMNVQDWFPLGWTGWISLQFKWLSRVFSNTTVQKYQFFSSQLSL